MPTFVGMTVEGREGRGRIVRGTVCRMGRRRGNFCKSSPAPPQNFLSFGEFLRAGVLDSHFRGNDGGMLRE